jgi:hypothetical protein
VDEERRHDRREVAAAFAAGREEDELGARLRCIGPGQHAVGLDLGVEPGWAVGIAARDDEGPRRVAPGEHPDQRRGVLADLGRRAMTTGSSRSSGGDVALRLAALALGRQRCPGPDSGQLSLDALDRVGPRRPAQGGLADGVRLVEDGRPAGLAHRQIRRQRRPSRSMSASAASGPHVPAA